MKPIPLIIDCDPGVDDAIALLLAFAAPELRLLGITTVAGNVPLSLTSSNARRICELAHRTDIPIYPGCPRPLLNALTTAAEVHGETGLTGITLPEPTMALQSVHAVDFIIDTILNSAPPITLATLGPLTNLAIALIKEPRIAQNIQQVVIMGGAITHGNITPSAEFNIYCDPHAAHVVFTSNLPITLITLDVTHTAIATPKRLQNLRDRQHPLCEAVANLLQSYGSYDQERHGFEGAPLHDPCVIAYLTDPHLFRTRPCPASIELQSPTSLGRTIIDWYNTSQNPKTINIATTINAEAFFQMLGDRISGL
ncbi:MAG: nucleoside hydrolase [Alkalinema sp. RU_4_3]|nr:nucleoside hydrolase [Alkalinema sp. RU_4_3]